MGLSARSLKKASKRVPGAFRPQGPKKSEKSRKRSKKLRKKLGKTVNFLLFSDFWGPRGPGNPFRDFFPILGRKTQMSPVNCQQSCKSIVCTARHFDISQGPLSMQHNNLGPKGIGTQTDQEYLLGGVLQIICIMLGTALALGATRILVKTLMSCYRTPGPWNCFF